MSAFRSSSFRCCDSTLGVNNHPTASSATVSTNATIVFPVPAHFPRKALQSSSPPRPLRIILVRHGESEGNVDESVYTRVPDPRIGLTAKGWEQALDCGRHIHEIVSAGNVNDWKVYFYVSPYLRTLETLRGIGRAFDRSSIAGVREEPRLREQDFGNFQDREKMRVEKEIRLRYGRFFYRFPNGESAADVYDRITGALSITSVVCFLHFHIVTATGFRETLKADIDIGRFQPPGQQNPNMNIVIVSHGLTLRVFLMRWYKWTVEQFEGLNNFGNGALLVMQTGFGERYSLLGHQTVEELQKFGFTEAMIDDQIWQRKAKPGELNYDCLTTGPSFFTHFD